MRIAIFTDTFAPEINGVARTLDKLAVYLEKEQIEYKIFAPESRNADPMTSQVQRITSLPFFLYPECRVALLNPMHIQQELKQFKPTLIHVATPFNLGLYGMYYGKKHGIPMVASYHTHFDDYLAYYHLQFLQKWIWTYMIWFHRPFSKVYVPSESAKEKLLSKSVHDQIEIWARGVNHNVYTPQNRTQEFRTTLGITEKNILLYVGRIAPEKNIQVVLDTFHALPEQIKQETHLLIVGDGPLLPTLRKNVHPKITFAGFRKGQELANIYASADLFLFPSSTETFGNVVLEAMASGLPVIGSNVGGVKHLITHGLNGFVCDPNDNKQLVSHVSTLLRNKSTREKFSQEARKSALMYSWDDIFQKLVLSYAQVIERSVKLHQAS